MKKTFTERRALLLNSESSSYWVKEAFYDLDRRDVVDVIGDLNLLILTFETKFNEMFAAGGEIA